ncbi:MAG TPA: response regulator [Syntrophales bacterium]|nr:response regulator [Syntrophales bacterium]
MIDNVSDIILVEDNAADIELVLDSFKENNLANRVKVLKDGEEALDYIFRTGKYKDCGMCETPKLILLDLKLPKVDGLEVLRRVRSDERTKSIPVVVLTASRADQERIESYRLGVNSYIVKPVDFTNFSHVVAQIGFYWAMINKPLF